MNSNRRVCPELFVSKQRNRKSHLRVPPTSNPQLISENIGEKFDFLVRFFECQVTARGNVTWAFKKTFHTVQNLISLYFHFSSPDDFLHASAFLKHPKKKNPKPDCNTWQIHFSCAFLKIHLNLNLILSLMSYTQSMKPALPTQL